VQRRSALRLLSRQSAILAAAWVASGSIFALINLDGGAAIAVPTLLGVLFGGGAAAGTGILLTQPTLRPILIAASRGSDGRVTAPGVLARLVGMWLLCTALPSGVIAAIIFIRANGWIIEKSASIEIPILVVSVAAMLIGLPVMILTSRSISDPLGEVVTAMAKVEQGQFDTFVGVYERSEIGRLQGGFNRMVAGLAERERMRDLFGRHVGDNVARRAIDEGVALSGDVREAAILYIDLVGSTQMAVNTPPEEVAEVLNAFFRIVVDAVDERGGLINKFEGDAALAVFGAPLQIDGAASAALATARDLADELRNLPLAFGIGVSAGNVFAGNVGAENRYEYTVIGDPVNEAARLADLAKTSERHILCSDAAVERADSGERGYWAAEGSVVLRGRNQATDVSAPARQDEGNS
jgi:class 3 adenylate cyclase